MESDAEFLDSMEAWVTGSLVFKREHRDRLFALARRGAEAAALNAWPGMYIHEWQRPWLGGMSGTDLILPLPQENPDAKA